MLVLTHSRSMAHRLGRDKSGRSTTEFVYLSVFIVVVAAVGVTVFGNSLGDFFHGFQLTQRGITLN